MTKILRAVALACLALTGCGSSDNGPPPPDAGPGLISHPELLRACARLSACGVTWARLADCVNGFHQRFVEFGQHHLYSQIYRCVNEGKGDCKAIRICMGFDGARPAKCESTYKARCEGAVAYNCDLIAHWEQVIDCSQGGLKCGVKASGTTTHAVCGGGPCDPTKHVTECRDDKILRCNGGAIEIDDCSARQLQCRPATKSVCEGTGRSCLPTHAQCDTKNNVLLDCVEGYISEVDCAQMFGSKTCVGNACVGDGTECNMSSDFDSCEGDTLVFCFDGHRERLDCKELGFIGCEKQNNIETCKAAQVYQ